MSPTYGREKPIDPKTLSEKQIIEAIVFHCQSMGSLAYYIAEEIAYARDDPAGLRVYQDELTGRLRAYHDRGRRA